MSSDAGTLAADRRWRRFMASDYLCPCCGQPSTGIYDFGYDQPDPCPHGLRGASGEETLVVGEDSLGTDLCVVDGGYYIRCVLPLPIRGSDESFAFGPWASVSEANFDRYVTASREGDFSDFTGCFGWLMNTLPGVEMDAALPCNVEMGNGSQRPQLFVHNGVHPLADMQRSGTPSTSSSTSTPPRATTSAPISATPDPCPAAAPDHGWTCPLGSGITAPWEEKR